VTREIPSVEFSLSYPELIFMGSSPCRPHSPEEVRKGWQGVCCWLCHTWHKSYSCKKNPWRLTEVSQSHRKLPSTDILELWAAAMEGHKSWGAGLGTTGEGQRWSGKVGSVASTLGI